MADVVVVGAGIAGLVGARVLAEHGHTVTVLDKGRNPGGRMASRRTPWDGDPATTPVWDHGAQFVTLREPALADETDRWRAAGWLVPWFHGAPDVDAAGEVPATPGGRDADGHPRFRGAPVMRSLPTALAAELGTVRCGVELTSVTHDDGRWRAVAGDAAWTADALLLTPPAPQALALAAGAGFADPLLAQLRRVTFDPCWAALAVPEGDTALPAAGIVRFPPGSHDVLDVVVDDLRKGASPVPAVTVHATADWTRARLEDDPATVGPALLAAARDVVGVPCRLVATHRWRYSAPTSTPDDPAPGGTAPGPVRLAGDAFTGGRVEGAALSGLRAAEALLDALG